MSEGIRLEGASAPPATPAARAPRIPFVRLRSLAWLAAAGAVVVAGLSLGTPHLRFEYLYEGSRERPFYLRCVYLGMPGFRVVEPHDGQCPLVRLMQAAPARGDR